MAGLAGDANSGFAGEGLLVDVAAPLALTLAQEPRRHVGHDVCAMETQEVMMAQRMRT